MADEKVTLDIDLEGDEQAISALKRLADKMDNLNESSVNVGKEVRKNRSAFMGFVKGITRAAAVIGSLTAAYHSLKTVVTGVTRVMKQGVQQAATFTSEITKAAARTDNATKALDTFRVAAKQASATSAFGAKDAANGLTEMAKAGFSAQQSAQALRGVLRQAAAAQVSVSEAASTSTGVLKSFRMETSKISEVNDTLVKAATTSKTTIQSLGDALGVVGSASEQAGLSLEETSAFIAKMQDKNLAASRASIALRRAIAVLSDPTSQAQKKMKKMGIELDKTKDVGQQLFSLFEQLQSSGNKVGNMARILGVRAGPTLQAALSQGVEGIKEYANELENAGGRAKEIEQTQLDNLHGTVKKLQGSFQNLVIKGFEPLEKQLQPVAEFLLRVVNNVQKNQKVMTGWTDTLSLVAKSFAFFGEHVHAMLEVMQAAGHVLRSVMAFLENLGLVSQDTVESFDGMNQVLDRTDRTMGNLIDHLNQVGFNLEKTADKTRQTSRAYKELERKADQATAAIGRQITMQQAQTRQEESLEVMDSMTKLFDDLKKSFRKFDARDSRHPLVLPDEALPPDELRSRKNNIEGISSKMRSLTNALSDVKQFGPAFDELLKGTSKENRQRLKKLRKEFQQNIVEADSMAAAFERLQKGQESMSVDEMRKKYRQFMRSIAQANAKFKRAATFAGQGKETDSPPTPSVVGGDGEASEGTKEELKAGGEALNILRLRNKIKAEDDKLRKRRLKSRMEAAKIGMKEVKLSEREVKMAKKMAEEEGVTKEEAAEQLKQKKKGLMRHFVRLEAQRKENQIIEERKKKLKEIQRQAERQTTLARQEKRIREANTKEQKVMEKAEKRRMNIHQKFAKKERKLQKEMKEISRDQLTDEQKETLEKQKQSELAESQKKKEEALNKIVGQRLSRMSQAMDKAGETNVMSGSFMDPEQVGGKFEKTVNRMEAEQDRMDALEQKRRDMKIGGASDQEIAKTKAKIEDQRKLVKLLKDEKQQRKEILQKHKKQIKRHQKEAKQFGNTASQMTSAFKSFRQNSDAIGNVLTGAAAGEGKKNIEDFSKGFEKMQAGLSGVGQASQQAMKALGVGTKERAITAAIFSTAKGIAYTAEAIMGHPSAGAAAAAHFAAAAKYGQIAGKAGKAQKSAAGGGGSVPSMSDVEKTSPGDIGKAIADELKDDQQGRVNVYDFSGATMLEGAPAIQKEINNANQQAKERRIRRERLDTGG